MNFNIFQTLYSRVINATRYSLQGMKAAYQSEMAFRLDLIIFGVNTVVLFFIHNPYFTVWLFFCGLFVLFAELANTALETIVNWISLERHPAAGRRSLCWLFGNFFRAIVLGWSMGGWL